MIVLRPMPSRSAASTLLPRVKSSASRITAASKRRAEAVAHYLEKHGVARDRLTIVALGEDRPVAPNANLDGSDNPEGRAKNRRVDLTVSPGSALEPAASPTPTPTPSPSAAPNQRQ